MGHRTNQGNPIWGPRYAAKKIREGERQVAAVEDDGRTQSVAAGGHSSGDVVVVGWFVHRVGAT